MPNGISEWVWFPKGVPHGHAPSTKPHDCSSRSTAPSRRRVPGGAVAKRAAGGGHAWGFHRVCAAPKGLASSPTSGTAGAWLRQVSTCVSVSLADRDLVFQDPRGRSGAAPPHEQNPTLAPAVSRSRAKRVPGGAVAKQAAGGGHAPQYKTPRLLQPFHGAERSEYRGAQSRSELRGAGTPPRTKHY